MENKGAALIFILAPPKDIFIMQISRNTTRYTARTAAPQAAPKQEAAPQESVTLGKSSHYSGGNTAYRVLAGAATGLGAHYLTGGSTWGTAKLGAAINGVGGAVVGGVMGGVAGAAAGSAGAGAAIGAVTVGGIGAVTGLAKGALVGVIGNAFGGGPIAFAGAGAALGLIGL